MTDSAEVIRAAVNNALSAAAVANFDPTKVNQFAVVPDGFAPLSLEKFQRDPNRIKAIQRFEDIASLAQYLATWGEPETMISVSSSNACISAVIDHHDTMSEHKPRACEHRASFEAQLHPVIKLWLGMQGKTLSQLQFGRFLEDRAQDVISPDAASVMEMVMTFDAIKKVTFRSSQRLHDGRRQFNYSEENEARGATTLPEYFLVRAPIYSGMEPQDVKFMIRYDINDGALLFRIEMHNQELVMLEAFEKCVLALREAIKGTDCENNPFYRVIA